MTQNEKEVAQVRREAREYWEKQLQTIVEKHQKERDRLISIAQMEVKKQTHLRRKIKNLRKEVRGLRKHIATIKHDKSWGSLNGLRSSHNRLLSTCMHQQSEINKLRGILNRGG